MQIVRAALADLDAIEPLRLALWPDSPIDELKATVAGKPDYLVLIAREGDEPIGFAEVAVRHDYVNGCDTSPVAFLEGIYVTPPARKRGVARALIEHAKAAVVEQGLREFASDALLDNDASHAFHKAVGFGEVERVVCFRQQLADRTA